MYAHIDHNEAERIRRHFRVYLPGNPDIVEDSELDSSDTVPVVISWYENPPQSEMTGCLLFDFDEDWIPTLYVSATGDGFGFDGHTYTHVLSRELGEYLKQWIESDAAHPRYDLFTLFIDNEISYEFSRSASFRSDSTKSARAYPY